jgi:hypothetical protein
MSPDQGSGLTHELRNDPLSLRRERILFCLGLDNAKQSVALYSIFDEKLSIYKDFQPQVQRRPADMRVKPADALVDVILGFTVVSHHP